MDEYSHYVWSVYFLATVVYGGLTMLWWHRLRHLRQRLKTEGADLHE